MYDTISFEKFQSLQSKYKDVLHAHYSALEQIGIMYTVANNLTSVHSPEMQQVIDLCLYDISLAPKIAQYFKEESIVLNNEYRLPDYGSFKRLAIIYEKQNRLIDAINICKKAIALGFYQDGTYGQIPGRMARLIKKAKDTNLLISSNTQTMNCPHCRKEIDINSNFCNFCGQKQ